MQVPSAGMIEIAADQIKEVPPDHLNNQRTELYAFGQKRAQNLGALGITEDFAIGYELGLQVARVMLQGMPQAAAVKINL